MSRNHGALLRAHPAPSLRLAPATAPLRAAGILFPAILVLASIGAGTVAADRPAGVVALSADEAARAGLGIAFRIHQLAGAEVLELRPARGPDARGAPALLAISPDGSLAALADMRGQDPTALTIARADGSQLRIPAQGAIAASFSADGAALAFVDGLGRLSSVDTAAGSATILAEGPFLGPISLEASGSVLALSVSSVEAPFLSRLVRVAPDGSSATLSDESLVYAVSPLTDGSLVLVAHRPSGTVVQQVQEGAGRTLIDLGRGAVNVSIAPDASTVAFERASAIYVQQLGAGTAPRPIGAGSNPRFAPDGSSLLVDTGDGSAVIALDGSVLGQFASSIGFVACPAGCAP